MDITSTTWRDLNVPVTVVFGVPVEGITYPRAMEVIDEFIQDGRMTGRTHQIATVNVDFLVNAVSDPNLLSLLQDTSLNLADGMPVLWASRLLGTPLPERVAGADLMSLLSTESERRGWRIHLLGGRPGVAERARSAMLSKNPGALITADAGPMLLPDEHVADDVLAGISSLDVDILCVAFGNPKQERFIAQHRDRLGCPVMIGIGGSLDLMVGDRRRAPAWMQRTGLEWVVRAIQEPRRLGPRYGRDAKVFGPRLVRYHRLVQIQNRGLGSNEGVEVTEAGGVLQVHLDGLTGLSPKAHAEVCMIARCAQRSGRQVRSGEWSDEMRRCLESFGTHDWLERVMFG